jgi:ABC-type transporter Mla maintaining outer membrane lipid asymmetry permease subunit MlaE
VAEVNSVVFSILVAILLTALFSLIVFRKSNQKN